MKNTKIKYKKELVQAFFLCSGDEFKLAGQRFRVSAVETLDSDEATSDTSRVSFYPIDSEFFAVGHIVVPTGNQFRISRPHYKQKDGEWLSAPEIQRKLAIKDAEKRRKRTNKERVARGLPPLGSPYRGLPRVPQMPMER